MAGKKSDTVMEQEYGRHIAIESKTAWNALTKAVEKDKMVADIVDGANALSGPRN